ncbi:hypothetical protein Val02_00820 [Virgisporangium aliadipatigenens]|uniref:DUF4281 domain-containing protein n=1 Tax=Virgisporangium aliadipatigenens TaxID=741659 RepID=A0A8J4DMW0_9ACTN|nr:ABA4-like family protein [Virgisporangium aliadipatigenens]GIJ43196.1 hypothetical protein Val02_00820 [Virgisporangium aliadipatigenens]
MTEFLFELTFLVAAPFWALMIVLPGWAWTARIVRSPLIVLPPVLVYAVLVLPAVGDILPAVANPSLPGIRELFAGATGAAAVWAHVIAFDLFVGRWIWLDARERNVPWWIVSPLLVLVIMLAPLGLLLYLGICRRWPRVHT